ncbi:MAG: hypothetical protein AB8I08_30330 [Sandaracinaceae bacterium]
MWKQCVSPVIVLTLVACGGVRPAPTQIGEAIRLERCPPVEPDAEAPFVALEMCLEADAVAAARFVTSTLRHAQVGADITDALAPGATRVFSRSPAQGPEVTLSREDHLAVVAARREAYGPPDPEEEDGLQVGYRQVAVETEGPVHRVRGEALSLVGMGEDSERYGLEAEVHATASGLRLMRLRTWPLAWSTQDEFEDYDEAYWARMDARAEQAAEALDTTDPESRRRLVAALQAAHRYAEARDALTPLLQDPNLLDVTMLADLSGALGRPGEAAAARARLDAGDLPPGSLAAHLREVCRYPLSPEENARPERARAMLEDDPDGYYEVWERCDARVLHAAGTRERPLGLARIVRGAQERETTEFFFWDDGVWSEGIEVSDGPFNGNQTAGVTAFEVSDAEALAMDGMTGIRAHYQRERLTDDGQALDEGVLLCVRETSACLLIPEAVTMTDADGAVTHHQYEVRLTEDAVRVRRTSGPPAEDEMSGEQALRAWFNR